MYNYLDDLKNQRIAINKEIDRVEWIQSLKVDDEVAINLDDTYVIGKVSRKTCNEDLIYVTTNDNTPEYKFYISNGEDKDGNKLEFLSNEIKLIVEKDKIVNRLCNLLCDQDLEVEELSYEQIKDIDNLISKYLAGESFLKKYLSGELTLSGMSSCGIGKIYI